MSEIMKFELVNCKNILGLYEICNLYNVLFWLKKVLTRFGRIKSQPLAFCGRI